MADSAGPVPAVTGKTAVTSAAAIAAGPEHSARAAGSAGTPQTAVATSSRPEVRPAIDKKGKRTLAGYCPGCAGSTTTAAPAVAAVAGGSPAVTADPTAATTTAGQAGPGGPTPAGATGDPTGRYPARAADSAVAA